MEEDELERLISVAHGKESFIDSTADKLEDKQNKDAHQAVVIAKYTVGNYEEFPPASEPEPEIKGVPMIEKNEDSFEESSVTSKPADLNPAARSNSDNLLAFEGFNIDDTYHVPNMAESYHSVVKADRFKRRRHVFKNFEM